MQIQNCAKVGGGVPIGPLAQVDDGLLDVVFGITESKLNFLSVAKKVHNGLHIFEDCVEYYRGKNIKIKKEGRF